MSAGPSLLIQEDHASPLCCGERDSWSAPGARVGVVAEWVLAGWFVPSLELWAGTNFASGDGESFQVHTAHLDAVAGVALSDMAGVIPRVGVGVGIGGRWLARENSDHDSHERAVAGLVRAGVDVPRGETLFLGCELTLQKWFAEHQVSMAFRVTWP